MICLYDTYVKGSSSTPVAPSLKLIISSLEFGVQHQLVYRLLTYI